MSSFLEDFKKERSFELDKGAEYDVKKYKEYKKKQGKLANQIDILSKHKNVIRNAKNKRKRNWMEDYAGLINKELSPAEVKNRTNVYQNYGMMHEASKPSRKENKRILREKLNKYESRKKAYEKAIDSEYLRRAKMRDRERREKKAEKRASKMNKLDEYKLKRVKNKLKRTKL